MKLSLVHCVAILLASAGVVGAAPTTDSVNRILAKRPDLSDHFIRAWEPMPVARGLIESPQMTSRDGSTALSWTETKSVTERGSRYLVLADQRLQTTAWGAAIQELPPTGDGDRTTPLLSLNPVTSSPGMVWLESNVAENKVQFFHQNKTETVFSTTNLLEFASFDFDGTGVPYLAWAEQVGGRSEVSIAVKQEAGNWVIQSVSPPQRAYDLMPQIFANNSGAEIYWYSIDGSDIIGRRAFLNLGGADLSRVFSTRDIPAYRLPTLYRVGEERLLGALWIEQTESGELYLDLNPTRANPSSPYILGNEDNPPNLVAVSDDVWAAKAWVERDTATSKMLVAENPWGEPIRVPIGRISTMPDISVSSNWVHLTWVDEDAETGIQTLWYMRAR